MSPATKTPYGQAIIDATVQQFTNARKSGPVQLAQFPDSATHVNSKRSSLLPPDTVSQRGKTDVKIANSVKEQQDEDPIERFACEAGGGRASGEDSVVENIPLERTQINLQEQPLSHIGGTNASRKN